jgi:hypothetical protein
MDLVFDLISPLKRGIALTAMSLLLFRLLRTALIFIIYFHNHQVHGARE